MKRILSVVLLVGLIFPTGLNAAGQTTPNIAYTTIGRQNPVEQESPDWQYGDNIYNVWRCTHYADGTEHPDNCVYNPTDCDWDVDDGSGKSGNGVIDANTTVIGTICTIADGYDNAAGDNKWVEVTVYAPVNTLSVKLTDNFGHLWTAVPVVYGREYKYNICYRETLGGPFPIIDNSNGGTGLEIDYTLNISAGKRAVRDVFIYLQTYGLWPVYQTNC